MRCPFVLRTKTSIAFRFCSIRCRDEYFDWYAKNAGASMIRGLYKAIEDDGPRCDCDQESYCSKRTARETR